MPLSKCISYFNDVKSILANKSFNVSDQHLAIALDQMAVGFWEVSLSEGNFMSCTDQCKRNFGRNPSDDFSYADMQESIVEEDSDSMQAAVAKAIHDQTPYFAQYRVKLPGGAIRWIEAQGLVIREGNTPEKIIGTTLDITRTKDLETLRDELLSVAMHELKSPLSAVKGSLQILERYLQLLNDEKILAVATRALSSTERITRLLNDMSQPFAAQTQEIVLQKSTFDILPLINEIKENTILLHQDHKINIISEQVVMTITADRFRIGQVITNLINNAVKYSPGEFEIQIAVGVSTGNVMVKISDQGMGIAPEHRKKVFQKFYRAGQRKQIDGLGIGLYLCSEIIIRHGGIIGFEDKLLPGSTVYFTLPS